MSHTPHELHEQFPDKTDIIHRLKTEDAHFARQAQDYHDLNRAIHRAESGIEPTDDHHLEDLKKRRLLMLDEISGALNNA